MSFARKACDISGKEVDSPSRCAGIGIAFTREDTPSRMYWVGTVLQRLWPVQLLDIALDKHNE